MFLTCATTSFHACFYCLHFGRDEYISRPPDYEYESGFTNRVYHAELLCHHKALRRKNLPTTIRREEVQCSSELEQQSVSSMGSNVVRDSLHLLVVPLSAIYLSVFFCFFFFIGRTWSTFKLGTKPSATNFLDRKLNMIAAR